MEKIITHKLTTAERADHKRDEAIIRKGIKSFLETGSALMRIKARKSYLETHETFGEYCQEVWGFGNKEASRQMISAAVVNHLDEELKKQQLDLPLPRSESVARELHRAPEVERVAVWKQAVAESSKGKVTAANVSKFVPEPKAIRKPKARKTSLRSVKTQVAALSPDDRRKLFVELEAEMTASVS